jgi:thiamine biosynthesis lipoprotein
MQAIAVARLAMATRFEILLHGENVPSLRAAAEEALDEIDRLEAQLSLYRRTSEISRVNALAAHEAVRVSPGVFRLLQHAQRLSAETGGAFDITIAPLVRCWGFMGGTGQMPAADQVAEARSKVGMNLVELNAADFTVRFAREGVMLDLGGIGKGYAVECAAGLLREAGVKSALLNGGTSTIHALGCPPEGEAWQVALEYPQGAGGKMDRKHLAAVSLCDEALSVSAVWGRSFKADGKTFGHVLDPRSGQPVTGALLAAVITASATETDALSTALLVAGKAGHDQIANVRAGMRTLVLSEAAGPGEEFSILGRGILKEAW